MDFFDEQILTMLREGKPKVLAQLIDYVDSRQKYSEVTS